MKVKVEIQTKNAEEHTTERIIFFLHVKSLQEAITLTDIRIAENKYIEEYTVYIFDESGEIIYSNIFL